MKKYRPWRRFPGERHDGATQRLVDNRYRIVKPLGGGGMAEVYLAHDEVLGRDVALKTLHRRYAGNAEFVERFRREARNAASLSHPHVVLVHDWGETGDSTYYIAMEYVPGGTLKDRILQRGTLSPKEAAEVAIQTARGLEAAHRRGVIHRDIKPQNILVSASGEVKVADFGIAKAASFSSLTRTGFVMGTERYMSPEQARGGPVTPRSDLYSLGVVLYEMLTGELPRTVTGSVGSLQKHGRGNSRPSEVAPRIPEELNDIIVRLLAQDPKRRYADTASLITDLERARKRLLEPDITRVLTSAATRVRAALKSQTPKTRPPPIPRSQNARGKVGKQRRRSAIPLLLLVMLALVGMLVLVSAAGLAGLSRLSEPGGEVANPPPAPPETRPAPAVPSTPRPDPPATPTMPQPVPSIPSGDPGSSAFQDSQGSPSEGSADRPQDSLEEMVDRIEKELERMPSSDE